jgi:hypothetical protein
MRGCSVRGAAAIALACWLAGGPGGLVLRATLACRHQAMAPLHQHHAGVPADGPCFCEAMTPGADMGIVPPGVPAPAPPVVPVAARVTRLPAPRPPAQPAAPEVSPLSPPPDGRPA